MRSKLPALVLLCAAFGLIASSDLNAGDKKKPTESRQSDQAKKPRPGKPDSKSARSKKKSAKTDALHAQIKKLEDQLAENRKELEKVRDSFHTAQKELAAKAQAITALEKNKRSHDEALKKAEADLQKANGALKNATLDYGKASDELRKFKSMDFNKLAHGLDAERKKNAALQAQLKGTQQKAQEAVAKAAAQVAAARKPAPSNKKPAPKKAEPKKPSPDQRKAPAIAPVAYDLNSAVNFKERDRVLSQLRAVLKRSPNARIQITGYADDTPYKMANEEVGANRARYLAKYLTLKGLPDKQISCRGVGSPKQGRGNGNRKVTIQIRD